MERDDLTMLVARNIEAAIARQGLNPAEVARRANINPTGIYDILKGKSRHPRLDTIKKIAVDGLGIPVSMLFAEPNEDDIDREIAEKLGLLSLDERRKFLRIARAMLEGNIGDKE